MSTNYMTPLEAARRLGVSERTMRRWLKKKKVEGSKLPGGRWYISVQWVEDQRRILERAKLGQ